MSDRVTAAIAGMMWSAIALLVFAGVICFVVAWVSSRHSDDDDYTGDQL